MRSTAGHTLIDRHIQEDSGLLLGWVLSPVITLQRAPSLLSSTSPPTKILAPPFSSLDRRRPTLSPRPVRSYWCLVLTSKVPRAHPLSSAFALDYSRGPAGLVFFQFFVGLAPSHPLVSTQMPCLERDFWHLLFLNSVPSHC